MVDLFLPAVTIETTVDDAILGLRRARRGALVVPTEQRILLASHQVLLKARERHLLDMRELVEDFKLPAVELVDEARTPRGLARLESIVAGVALPLVNVRLAIAQMPLTAILVCDGDGHVFLPGEQQVNQPCPNCSGIIRKA